MSRAPRKRLINLLLFVGFVFIYQSAFAQKPDSITQHYDSLAKIKLQQLDSSGNRFNSKVDSAQQRLNNILNPNLNKFASKLKPKNKLEVPDSLRATHELDSMKRGITHTIDSLKSLHLPTDKYTRKLDSLNAIGPSKYIAMANKKIQSVDSKLNNSVNNIENKINSKIPDELNKKVSVDNLNLPNANGLPNTNIKTDLNGVTNPLSKVENPITNIDNPIAKIENPIGNNINQLNSAKENLGEVNQVTDKLQSYQGDVKNITNGDLSEVKSVPNAIENKVTSLNEIKELQTQTGEMNKATGQLDEIKGMAGKANDPEAMKTMAKQELQKQAVNHFKGKEEVLQQAMDKMSKLKSKYSEISSLTDITKRPPNPMKGKPLIERIIPGVTIQVQKTHNVWIDIDPVVSYRFSGRINGGLGWNERLAFTKWNKLAPQDRIYGPRVFGSFSFKKGYAAKAEVEKMNTLIPSSVVSPDGSRQWVWSVFVGMKKDYTFIGRVKGNVQVLYNLYDDHYNSPYSDKLNVRMGFEFPMKKAKRPVK
ncbi:MAG: hypothetical protein WDO14_18085 [Bacteroidota bacterium]